MLVTMLSIEFRGWVKLKNAMAAAPSRVKYLFRLTLRSAFCCYIKASCTSGFSGGIGAKPPNSSFLF